MGRSVKLWESGRKRQRHLEARSIPAVQSNWKRSRWTLFVIKVIFQCVEHQPIHPASIAVRHYFHENKECAYWWSQRNRETHDDEYQWLLSHRRFAVYYCWLYNTRPYSKRYHQWSSKGAENWYFCRWRLLGPPGLHHEETAELSGRLHRPSLESCWWNPLKRLISRYWNGDKEIDELIYLDA